MNECECACGLARRQRDTEHIGAGRRRMHLTQPIHKGLNEKPSSTAIVFGDRRLTFAGLADRVARCAAVLRAIGLRPGDRVGMMALNSDRYVEYLFGVCGCGSRQIQCIAGQEMKIKEMELA